MKLTKKGYKMFHIYINSIKQSSWKTFSLAEKELVRLRKLHGNNNICSKGKIEISTK